MLTKRSVPFFAMNLFLVSLAFQVSFVVSVFCLPVLGRQNAETYFSSSLFSLGGLDCCKTF